MSRASRNNIGHCAGLLIQKTGSPELTGVVFEVIGLSEQDILGPTDNSPVLVRYPMVRGWTIIF